MGMLPVKIDERTEVRVKDNVCSPAGWHLWGSLYIDGEYIAGDEIAVVPDLDDATLRQAALAWYVQRAGLERALSAAHELFTDLVDYVDLTDAGNVVVDDQDADSPYDAVVETIVRAAWSAGTAEVERLRPQDAPTEGDR
jgi:hypothetical protein